MARGLRLLGLEGVGSVKGAFLGCPWFLQFKFFVIKQLHLGFFWMS